MIVPSSQSVLFWLRFVTALQTALLLAAYACGLRKDRAYPAMRVYLLVNTIGGILVCTLIGFPGLLAGSESTVYCTLFWVAYGTSGVLTFLTAQQIFRDALDPLPGLRRLALVAFRWVAVVSVALSVVPAIVPLFFHAHSLQVTVLQAMRCVSVLEFCLLAFILLSAQALGISWRSRIVGITLGFGVLAVVDTVCFMFLLRSLSQLLPWLLVRETGSLVAAAIWLTYLLMREPQRTAVRLKNSSQLQKWNEIAVALGKPAPHIAFGQPEPPPFFLQDVERVVDRVLSRNEVDPPRAG
ncbi:MAG TPA: hypothetical protein VGM02_00285 [Acidobacteriaceae bacterium]|jgi:hypothetical protein